MSLFAEAIDDLFADPELARDAVWRAGGVGDGVTVRAVVRLADRVTEFGAARIASGTALVEVRTAEVAAPAEGDAITVAGRTLVVQGEPLADAERLVWKLDCREA